MATHNLGHRYDDISDYTATDVFFDLDTGMVYEYHRAEPMSATAYRAIIGAYHDGVGLVTYYGFDSRDEALNFIPDSADISG